MRHRKSDRFLWGIIIALALAGFFIFTSASLGLLSRGGASFSTVAVKQFAILITGLVVMIIASNISYKHWKKFALPLLALGIILCAAVFIPKIGMSAGGAKRWIIFGPKSFQLTLQPAEVLKLGLVIYLAAWFSSIKDKLRSFKWGFMPYIFLVGIAGALIILQPDTGTFMVLISASLAMFIAAGGKWSHLGIMILGGILLVSFLAYTKPYVRNRIMTFVDPSKDALGASYQINQSLIAIGSGGITGRGFGQSIQKFNFLPEPIGDSIFAVASEEFGFLGSTAIVILFTLFGLWGLKISSQIVDPFGRLIGVGIVILMLSQSFINMAAMLGLIPLTGVPLVFVSHGGTALLFACLEAGILLNISRHKT